MAADVPTATESSTLARSVDPADGQSTSTSTTTHVATQPSKATKATTAPPLKTNGHRVIQSHTWITYNLRKSDFVATNYIFPASGSPESQSPEISGIDRDFIDVVYREYLLPAELADRTIDFSNKEAIIAALFEKPTTAGYVNSTVTFDGVAEHLYDPQALLTGALVMKRDDKRNWIHEALDWKARTYIPRLVDLTNPNIQPINVFVPEGLRDALGFKAGSKVRLSVRPTNTEVDLELQYVLNIVGMLRKFPGKPFSSFRQIMEHACIVMPSDSLERIHSDVKRVIKLAALKDPRIQDGGQHGRELNLFSAGRGSSLSRHIREKLKRENAGATAAPPQETPNGAPPQDPARRREPADLKKAAEAWLLGPSGPPELKKSRFTFDSQSFVTKLAEKEWQKVAESQERTKTQTTASPQQNTPHSTETTTSVSSTESGSRRLAAYESDLAVPTVPSDSADNESTSRKSTPRNLQADGSTPPRWRQPSEQYRTTYVQYIPRTRKTQLNVGADSSEVMDSLFGSVAHAVSRDARDTSLGSSQLLIKFVPNTSVEEREACINTIRYVFCCCCCY